MPPELLTVEEIESSYIERLKILFDVSMKDRTPKQYREKIPHLWEIIINIHKNHPYHNLNRYVEILDLLGEHQVYIDPNVALAMFLQNFKFSPWSQNSKKEAADYAASVLKNHYGWRERDFQEVYELILYSVVLKTPDEKENFNKRLMYDLRNLRLALRWADFRENMHDLKKEYKELDEKEFIELHLKLFRWLCFQRKTFSLDYIWKKYNEAAAHNIRKYIVSCDVRLMQIDEDEKKRLENLIRVDNEVEAKVKNLMKDG